MHENGNEQPKVELWWGVQCKNRDCNKAFAVRLGGDEHPIFDMTAGTLEEKTAVVEEAAIAIEDIVRKSAFLNGVNAQPRDSVDLAALLQLCPHCGRLYFYARGDFFLTHEPVPTAQERA